MHVAYFNEGGGCYTHTVCFHDWKHELNSHFSVMKHSVCKRFYPSNYMQRNLWRLPQILVGIIRVKLLEWTSELFSVFAWNVI